MSTFFKLMKKYALLTKYYMINQHTYLPSTDVDL